MRIGLVAPPWVPVPPTTYGGTEGVIDVLARGLVAQGHEVVLATTGDATCPVERTWAYGSPPEPMGSTLPELHHVQVAYEQLADCDVIHDHTLTGPLWAASLQDRPPVLATNHGEFSEPVQRYFAHVVGSVVVSAISHSQARQATGVEIAGVVHHGLELERFEVGEGDGGYVVAVGRCCPDKGIAEAIEIATRAGVPIKVAAKKREDLEIRYFEERVAPLLGPGVEYLGEVSPERRDELFRGALALLNPITWQEPFGLVMVEALGCGTPVVGFPYGAAEEIVDDGVTGYLCGSVDEAVDALARVPELERKACRRAVEERFTAERMVSEYVELYEQVLQGRAAGG